MTTTKGVRNLWLLTPEAVQHEEGSEGQQASCDGGGWSGGRPASEELELLRRTGHQEAQLEGRCSMVKEVEALYGEPAPAGGIGWMTAAWHALNASFDEFVVDNAEGAVGAVLVRTEEPLSFAPHYALREASFSE